MTVTVLLFASYADALGASIARRSSSPDGATVARRALRSVRAMPGAERLPPKPLVAVNEQYARCDRTLVRDGDEVAIIPPVAGG